MSTDLSILDPELQKKIRVSPEWRYREPNTFIQQLYELARENINQPLKYFAHEGMITQAHSLPEAILYFNQKLYRKMISGWNIDLSGESIPQYSDLLDPIP